MNFPKGEPDFSTVSAPVKMAKQWEKNTKFPTKFGAQKTDR